MRFLCASNRIESRRSMEPLRDETRAELGDNCVLSDSVSVSRQTLGRVTQRGGLVASVVASSATFPLMGECECHRASVCASSTPLCLAI